jgi:carbonic anhydrase
MLLKRIFPALLLTLAGSSLLFTVVGASQLTADEVIALLTKGNERFATDHPAYPHQGLARRAEVVTGQHPLATVISCSDSRVPPELLFDEGLGDLFIVRVIGNIGGIDETGSAEYGVEHLDTPLLVVLGHTQCGAVTAAVKHAEVHGNIPPLLAHIQPAVQSARHTHPAWRGDTLIPAAIEANVFHSIAELFHRSSIIRERVRHGKLKVTGALYDIQTGRVNWLGPHPHEAALIKPRGHQGRPGAHKG